MEWQKVVKTVAPALGTALGGPLGGAAASFIADKLGLQEKTVEAIESAFSAGRLQPEQIASIKLAELEFKKFLAQNKIDLERLTVENIEGARRMQVAVKSRTVDVLAVIIVVGFFSILTLSMLGVLKVSDNQALLILLGSLSAGFGAVLNFFFGSSRGSQNKDLLLANSTPADSQK